ncbi:MAG: hypothetical protein SGI73_19275 [Chloroflexota bacterium]|nr:hypothetical protein [Chloroflexota bacterium]
MTPNETAALTHSNAGMRLIAQTKLYNDGDFARFAQFIADNYTQVPLAEETAEHRAGAWGIVRDQIGRLRIRQVLGIDKLHVIALMDAEKLPDTLFLNEVLVEEAYPHKIAVYVHQRIETE